MERGKQKLQARGREKEVAVNDVDETKTDENEKRRDGRENEEVVEKKKEGRIKVVKREKRGGMVPGYEDKMEGRPLVWGGRKTREWR
jgi:hypothetical protein